MTDEALQAVTAVGGRHDDVVADLDPCDVGADDLDNSGAFVAEHDRHRDRVDSVAHRHVGVADADSNDSNACFVS